MPTERASDADVQTVTRHLQELRNGRREAFDRLLPKVYDELRRVAGRQLYGERAGHTINATALVHEAYIRLVDYRNMDWQSRAHFYAVAAQAMRRILVSYARRRNALKRGGDAVCVTLDEGLQESEPEWTQDLLSLDEALGQLEAINARHARIVECRFFAGLTIAETAETLGISDITVTRDWRMARAWLKDTLGEN